MNDIDFLKSRGYVFHGFFIETPYKEFTRESIPRDEDKILGRLVWEEGYGMGVKGFKPR